jgi:MFS family permease
VWLSLRHVPESRDETLVGRPDILGAVLAAVGLGGLTTALVEAPALGLANPIVVVAAALGVVSLGAFAVVQARRPDPLVPGRLFTDRTFVLANALTFLVYAALGGVLLLLVLQVQISLGYPPTVAGLVGLPITVIMLLLSARSGRFAQRFGPRLQLVVGPLLLAAGMLLMRWVTPGASYLGGVLPGVLVFGLGLAVVVAPVTATVLAASPDRYVGVASAVNNAVARTGTLVAVAVLPAVAGLHGADYTNPTALTAGWRTALLVCAVAAAVGGLFALGVDNRVLLETPEAAVPEPAEPVAVPQPASPGPGECLYCGVEGPPTYLRPACRRRG